VTSVFASATDRPSVQAFLILGTDAVLAARPATAVQLAHACAAIGFDVVVPATWGDEIVARTLADRMRVASTPVVQCSCPLVARRFAEYGGVLDGMVARVVPPPVAAARYVRGAYNDRALRITFAGDCPFTAAESIDEHLSCAGLFERLAQRGVDVGVQPTEYDSVIPPDRRRHFSEPGGVPSRDVLLRMPGSPDVIEVTSGDASAEVAQHLLSGARALLDIAVAVGCRCSGAGDDAAASDARARVRAQEPPRAPSPVVDHDVAITVDEDLVEEVERRGEAPAETPPEEFESVPESNGGALVTADVTARRRSSPGSTRAVMGAMPLARSDAGRQLPRAYVARRRSSPRGLRQPVVPREAPSATPAEERPVRWVLIALLGLAAGVLITLALAAMG